MFTYATKHFGVWKQDKRHNHITRQLGRVQFVVALSVMAFVVWLTFFVVVKIRQEFFFIESAPISLIKNGQILPSFFISERPANIAVFIKKDASNFLNIYFDNGDNFSLPKQSKKLVDYIKKRKENAIFLGMLLRINDDTNSRIKIWTQKQVQLEDIRFIMKIFSQYGFDSFDIAVER